MLKADFLKKLESELSGLEAAERQKSLDYYAEMIDDRIEDGMREADAVAAMGKVGDIVHEIYMDQPLPVILKGNRHRGMRGWTVALLILGSPLWLPLLMTAVILLLTVYLLIWAVVAVLWSGEASLILGALAGLVGGIGFGIRFGLPHALLLVGGALGCAGIGILWFWISCSLSRWLIRLTALYGRRIKAIFVKKVVR